MTLDLTKPIMLPHDKKPWRVVYCDDLSVLVEGGALNARAHHARQYIDEYAENIPPYTPPKPGPSDEECAAFAFITVDEALRGPWLYAEAAAEITRLRAERDALAKDATRYRWLSGRSAQSESPRWARWEIRRWTGRVWDTLDADGCDVEVDSAMEADAAMAGKP